MPNPWHIDGHEENEDNVDLAQVAVLAIRNIGIDYESPSNRVSTRLYYYLLVYICFWVRCAGSTESSF
jgi:hypothetical protein